MEQNMEKKFSLFKNNRWLLFATIVVSVIAQLSLVLLALSLKSLMDAGTAMDLQALYRQIYVCLVILIAMTVFSYSASQLKNLYIYRTMRKFKEDIFEEVIHQDYVTFQKVNSGSYLSMLTSGFQKIDEEYLSSFFEIIKSGVLLVFALFSMFLSNYKLAMMIIVVCILPIAISGLFAKKMEKAQTLETINDESYIAKVKDILLGFLVIKSFHVEDQIQKDYMKYNEKQVKTKYSSRKITELIIAISKMSSFSVIFVALAGGLFMVIKGNATVGDIIAVTQLVNFVVMPINELGVLMTKYKSGQTAYKNVLASIEPKQTIKLTDKTDFVKDIRFKDVQFAYPSDEKNPVNVLKNFNFVIEKNKKYAVVGLSGSGKSTILRLLLRFFDIQKGQGTLDVDGMNITDISQESIYEMMSIIQQDVYVFDQSLRDNITLNQEFSEEAIEEAVRLSGMKEFVSRKPLGIDMACGENGKLLSGGEKQRLSIARSLIRKTPILLMDEATSALDQTTSFEVEQAILKIPQLTAIVITHKLNGELLSQYDEIVVMNNGRIVEQGPFEQLLKQEGDFSKLYQVVQLED